MMNKPSFLFGDANLPSFIFSSTTAMIVLLVLFVAHPVFGQQAITEQVVIQDPDAAVGKPTRVQAEKAKSSAAEQQMLDEIKAIRQRMGGGVAERLKGLNLDDETNANNREEFEQELLRLNQQTRPMPGPAANYLPQPNSGSAANSRPVGNQSTYNERYEHYQRAMQEQMRSRQAALDFQQFNNQRQVDNQRQVENQRRVSSAVSSEEKLIRRQKDQLRDAARRLEELAAEFEESSLYEEADETRDRARRFWAKARQMRQ